MIWVAALLMGIFGFEDPRAQWLWVIGVALAALTWGGSRGNRSR